MHRHMQQKTNLEKLLLDNCLTILSYDMAIRIKFTTIKGVCLRARCFVHLKKFPTFAIQGLLPIIRNVMERLRGSIAPYFQCCEHCQKPISHIGETIFQNSYMHTIAQDMTQLGFHPAFSFLVGNHG